MVLDNQTFERVANLLTIPKNSVEYFGAYGSTVDFFVGNKTTDRDYVSGVIIRVTQDFKISEIRRVVITEGRFTRNYPVRRRTLPIYS